MRIGALAQATTADLDGLRQLGLRSMGWMRFEESPVGPDQADWKPHADRVGAEAKARGIQISAIGALYANPLDPRQTERAHAVFRRAIEVASYLRIRTVAGFPGAIIDTEVNARGGNIVYKPFEDYFPQLLAFWEPLAELAADLGVRIAFEHCPQGAWHLPVMGYNMLAQPAMWGRLFNLTKWENLGIEWDASHLICQFIDPVTNIHEFGRRIFHVHAKDAYINRRLLERYGICHPGVAEHRFPGLGQGNWAEIIHALRRTGYDSDLNIEGWHDPVYRDHPADAPTPLAGRQLEKTGMSIAKRTLEAYVPDE